MSETVQQHRVEIEGQWKLARDTYRVRFGCPDLARTIVPGQFVMIRLADWNDPLLGRAFALYDTARGDGSGEATGVDIVYQVQGKMTSRLATLGPGHPLDVWGPLGNGFPPQDTAHLIMVAGGIGQTPFLALAKEHLHRQRYGSPARRVPQVARITLLYGARSGDLLADIEAFERLGVEVQLATDDGSRGHRGLVTDLLAGVLAEREGPVRVVACGPEPMMEAASRLAARFGVACQVSLETPMACGLGICFSCVARVRMPEDEQGWDYRRTCIEGPVFDARDIVW